MAATMSRAQFLRVLLSAGAGIALAPLARVTRAQGTLASEENFDFWFTRLMYDSGDWDVDQRMPTNLLDALIHYTTLRVDPKERVVALADPRMLAAPMAYLAGHKLVAAFHRLFLGRLQQRNHVAPHLHLLVPLHLGQPLHGGLRGGQKTRHVDACALQQGFGTVVLTQHGNQNVSRLDIRVVIG